MPLGAPIGSNQGIETRRQIEIILNQATVPVVVDAGLGRPSHAAEALETDKDYTKYGRVNYVLSQRLHLLAEVERLQKSLDVAGDVLLWGPVDSQAPDALVTGIYSPDSCSSGSDA